MIVYNLTMKVAHSIHDEWVEWQKQEHIPEIMATKLFVDYKFYRLLDQDEEDGPTYVIQYVADNMSAYKKYIDDFAPAMRQKAMTKWGNGFITFRTVMEKVQ